MGPLAVRGREEGQGETFGWRFRRVESVVVLHRSAVAVANVNGN